MLFPDFDHVPDDALLTKAEVAVWRRTSVDTVEKDVREGRLVQVRISARRVGITARSVRALNRQLASDWSSGESAENRVCGQLAAVAAR